MALSGDGIRFRALLADIKLARVTFGPSGGQCLLSVIFDRLQLGFRVGSHEFRVALSANPCFLVGRDVGRIDRSERKFEGAPAGERLAPGAVWQAAQSAALVRYSPFATSADPVGCAWSPN
jgi:hypothetical protein